MCSRSLWRLARHCRRAVTNTAPEELPLRLSPCSLYKEAAPALPRGSLEAFGGHTSKSLCRGFGARALLVSERTQTFGDLVLRNLSVAAEQRSTENDERAQSNLEVNKKPTRIDPTLKPVFAVVQIGSHQFKVTPGDIIYTEKIKEAEVNMIVALDKVLMLGSREETMVGRPTLQDARVEALVEEQMLDAKVIVFKKKRRKNYRRTAGHRQQLTRLRILDVVGISPS